MTLVQIVVVKRSEMRHTLVLTVYTLYIHTAFASTCTCICGSLTLTVLVFVL